MKALFITIAAATLLACASTGSDQGTDEAAPVTDVTTSGKEERIQFGNQAAVATVEPAAAEDDPGYWEEMICKNEGVTGSRQVRRRCHTRYDWARMESAATETMRDIDSQPRGYRD
jgi:hypothetical protein